MQRTWTMDYVRTLMYKYTHVYTRTCVRGGRRRHSLTVKDLREKEGEVWRRMSEREEKGHRRGWGDRESNRNRPLDGRLESGPSYTTVKVPSSKSLHLSRVGTFVSFPTPTTTVTTFPTPTT